MNTATTEENIDYWTGVFLRLGLGHQGVNLNAFLNNPWRYLRLIGTGDLVANTNLLNIIPLQGTE